MIDISKPAREQIRRQFVTPTSPCIRIEALARGCNGPILRLVPDEPRPHDHIQREEGFDLVVNRDLEEELGGIRIRYSPSPFGGGSFAIAPLVDLTSGGCGDCRC